MRLTHREKKFSAHLVPAEILADAVAKPTVRAESVLDGIFAQSVVVLEADGDRLVYQTVWETLSTELRLDVHFSTVGGTGGIADTCKLYRTLKIPVAVIADLDIITEPARLRRVLEVMATPDVVSDLTTRARSIMEAIKRLPPTIAPGEVKERLIKLLGTGVSWDDEGDIALRRELVQMSHQLDRMRQLKRGGLSAFPNSIGTPLCQLVTWLKKSGVFLVPVGELEEWLAHAMIQESKENKWAWANAAALYIQSQGASTGDIWDFVREVGRYLCQR